MRLSRFICDNVEPLVVEFAGFARTMAPPASTMSELALRDHAQEILLAIASDMELSQTEAQRLEKSLSKSDPNRTSGTSAAAHGAMRQMVGFDLKQVIAEFRALRAAVLRRWQESRYPVDDRSLEDMTRFNEGVDQAVSESIDAYSARVSESREMFLAVLGHDLRSPLGALSGCLQLLAKFDPAAPQREKAFAIANRSVANIDMMITDLLEYTRTRLGRGIEVLPIVGDMGELCKDTFEEMRAAYSSRLLEFERLGDLTIAFDGPRMRQVLTNLLGNAVQHGDPIFPVHMSVRGGSEVVITVSNYGVPIPPESLQVIFDPLVQLAKHKTAANERPSTSLGLGLFIAREIVNAHGARITVSSSAESGTVFAVHMKR